MTRLDRDRVTAIAVACAVLALAALPQVAWACRCVPPAASAAYRRAALVVVGRIVSVEQRADVAIARVRVQVERVWKADVPAALTFTTATTCNYPVQPGERHLLYLTRSDSGELVSDRCMGNRALLEGQSADAVVWLERRGVRARVLGPALAE